MLLPAQRRLALPRTMDFKIIREFPAPKVETAWRDYLARTECPSHYDSPEFFLEPFWTGKKPFAVLAFNDEKVTGVLTGLHNGKNVSSGLPSRPQISVDTAQNSDATLETLLEGLLTEAASAELVNVYSWPSLQLSTFSARGFRSNELPGNVVLNLTLGADALFQQFSKDCRRNIRFAEKNGVEVSEAQNKQDIIDAYQVYCAWRDTARKTVVGDQNTFEVFEKAVNLKNNRVLFLARVDGKIVAINRFRYCSGGLFESSGNSSLDEYTRLKPNNLLQWKGIQWACSHGLRRHSLGGSHPFLVRFGGTVVPIMQYRLDRTWLHRHELRSNVEKVGRRIARKLPPWVVKGLPRPARKKDS
jgi:hypothetical protein